MLALHTKVYYVKCHRFGLENRGLLPLSKFLLEKVPLSLF